MGKALASPRRLELLELLAQAPRTVDELARTSGQSTANTSQHLQALHAAGLVTRQREGTRVRYELAGDEALSVWLALRDASAAQLARSSAPRATTSAKRSRAIGRTELRERLRAATSSSSTCARRRSSTPGTSKEPARFRSMSSKSSLAELPADLEIVAYCRGPFCAYAHEAVRQLRDAGRNARRLEDGWPEWRLAKSKRKRSKVA